VGDIGQAAILIAVKAGTSVLAGYYANATRERSYERVTGRRWPDYAAIANKANRRSRG
jgi:hypothetical protein